MGEKEIVVHHGAWNIRYEGGQYADIYYGGSTSVDCINYIHGDGTRTIPSRAQLRADLKEWVEENGEFYVEAVINYT
jgi:hypothetical protein